MYAPARFWKDLKLFVRLSFVLMIFCLGDPAFADNQMVRVRLMSGLSQWQVTGGTIRMNISGKLKDRSSGTRIKSSREVSLGMQSGVSLIEDTQPGKKISDLKVNGKLVPRDVRIILRDNNKWDVVAHITLRDYLKGVIPNEVPASWPSEALKAQAVVARTYTLFRMKQRRHMHFDVDSSSKDQVYRFESIRSDSIGHRSIDRVSQALSETESEVLLWKESGEIFPAFYHASCGGVTEKPSKVWGGKKLHWSRRRDSFCHYGKARRWHVKFSSNKVGHAMGCEGEVKDIDVRERSPSGRVFRIEVACKGKKLLISGDEFRRMLGPHRIKSTLFQMDFRRGMWDFSGKGFGHGVGLCQEGTHQRARFGSTYKLILAHYYPQAKLGNPYVLADYVKSMRRVKNIKTTTGNRL
jgi:stage II sporulation protein D